jgi:class 3 adenylate cyclase/tetratricopeptide (TPR) repeat protein
VAPAAPPSQPKAEPSTTHLEQYIPRELMSKLEAARANRSMAGERRIVTVLFCDVKGSTALAEMLDPEEWAEIMNGAFKYLIEPVYRYEGTLARLMGDAILAFFGAPIAHEDDPQRAILAALDIVESIKPFRERLKRERGFDLNVRIGINTGLVVVGEVGSDLRVEYTVMGDAVNLAARMEQTAEPGTVQIAGNTYKSVSNLFEFESLGALEVKGRSEPVAAYRVLRPREGALPTRGIEGLQSPLVGRERELALLELSIGELLAGRGQIVAVTGEAGLGKSRLMAELRKSLSLQIGSASDDGDGTKSVQWYEGRSLSYETATPYAPFAHLFSSLFGPRTDDTDEVKYGKVKASVGEVMAGQVDEVVPFLATLLDIKLPAGDVERVKYLDPPSLRGRVFQAAATLIETLASAGPLVLVFEDLHWTDPTSLELIEQLLPITERAQLSLIALFRPQPQDPSWRFHEIGSRDYAHRYTQVVLQPLNDEDSRQLVANLLEIEDLPEQVRALILKKSEGNPFFVEEVIRSLLDAKLVVREGDHWRATREIVNIAVPDTLAGVITARLDRLDDQSKYAAQTASVVGREFEYDVLSDVYELPATLDSAMSNLQRRELVREKSRIPHRAYLFKHVLTQETAYASLLLSRRRELHGRVAECLERMEDESASEIARHFLEARKEDRALPYLVEAGERAARAGARTEAVGFFKKAVEIVQNVEELGLARRAYEGLGKVLEFSMDPPGAFEAYHDMLHYAQEHNDIPMQVSALNKMSFLHAMVMGQFPEAESHLAEAERLASKHQDNDGMYELINMKCGMCMMAGDFGNANRYLSEAVEIGRKTNRLENMAYGLAHKANTLAVMVNFDESWEIAQEALRVSDEAGNLQHKANVLGEAITLYFMSKGDLDEAYKRSKQGYDIARRIGASIETIIPTIFMTAIAGLKGDYELALEWADRAEDKGRMLANVFPFMLAIALSQKGAICQEMGPAMAAKAKELHAEALSLLQSPAGAPAGGSSWPDLGFAAIARGDIEAATRYFENGLTMPSLMMNIHRPRSLCGAALAALMQGRIEDAARYVAEARQYAQEHSMKDIMPLVEITEGHLKEAKGDCDGALAHYDEAEQLSIKMGMRPAAMQARLSAAQALDKLGRREEADNKLESARAMAQEIASLIKNDSYRDMYLASLGGKLNVAEAATLS